MRIDSSKLLEALTGDSISVNQQINGLNLLDLDAQSKDNTSRNDTPLSDSLITGIQSTVQQMAHIPVSISNHLNIDAQSKVTQSVPNPPASGSKQDLIPSQLLSEAKTLMTQLAARVQSTQIGEDSKGNPTRK